MTIRHIGPISPIGPIRPIGPISPIGPMRPFRRLLAALLALLALAACDREPLDLYLKGDSEVRIDYNWTRYKYPYPNGLFVMFAKDGDSINISYPTHDLVGEDKDLMDNGTYKMLVMTNTFSEYEGNMRFFDTKSYEKARAASVTYNITDMNAWDYGRQYMVEPMPMGIAIDSFSVTMDNDGRKFYEYDTYAGVDTMLQKRELTILPMTTTLTIRVKVIGINYLKSPSLGGVDGYITGMADGFFLTQQWRSTTTGDFKLNHWTVIEEPTRATETGGSQTGWIATTIETFGLPHGRELLKDRTPQSNFIKLHFTMVDDNTIEFSYDVGKVMRYSGDDGSLSATFSQEDVSLELDLNIDAPFYDDEEVPIIPYAQPSGTGAFGADVEDWGKDENIDIPM